MFHDQTEVFSTVQPRTVADQMTFAIILYLTRHFANVIARHIVWYLAYLAADWLTDGGLNNVPNK